MQNVIRKHNPFICHILVANAMEMYQAYVYLTLRETQQPL